MIRDSLSKMVVVCLLGFAFAWVASTPAANAQDRDSESREESAAPRPGPREGAERPQRMAGGESPRAAWDPVAMRYPDVTWAALRFECAASDEEIARLQPVYREVRDQMETARTRAREARDPAGVAEAITQARARIEKELGATLGEARKSSLDEWLATWRTMAGGPPAGDRRGGARRVDAFYLDRTWSYLAFDLGLDAEQLARIEPAYRSAWDKRKAAAKAEDREAFAEVAEGVRASIETTLKETLTSEQWTRMQEEMAGARRAAGMRGAGGARGAGGGVRGPQRPE